MNGRCKLHGGLSTGAKTETGRRRSAQAAREGMKRYWANRRRREESSGMMPASLTRVQGKPKSRIRNRMGGWTPERRARQSHLRLSATPQVSHPPFGGIYLTAPGWVIFQKEGRRVGDSLAPGLVGLAT
ncbi:MAG: HGGxSTG domain-containing protein [Gammaproteobacteria bacterium]